MGCSSSRPSAAAAADPPPAVTTVPAPATRVSSAPRDRRPSRASRPSDTPTPLRPNKRIRSPSPVQRCPPERALTPWTPSQLARERDAFFDTRVTGDPAVWAAVRLICDMLRAGDVPGAQGMMDAAGLTCPTGRVKSDKFRGRDDARIKGGLYDEQGRNYDIPGWVVRDPADLAPEPVLEEKTLSGDSEDEWTDDGEGGRRRRDEKGKSRAEDVGELVKVRARLSDRGSDVLAEVGMKQKVRTLVRRISEQADDKRVRLVYLGKVLAEDKTLAEQGWQVGHVLNALVFD